MLAVPVSTARRLGLAAICAVALLQAINSFACYHQSLLGYFAAMGFIAIPMATALAALFTKNPLRAVGASLAFAPWLVFAYYTDCIRPYQGGGASMIYVAVVMYGFPCTLIAALLTGPVLRGMGVRIGDA